MTVDRYCTKYEFDAFIAAYPRKLVRDVACFYDPPLVTFNDFTLGKWPQSVVASYSFTDLDAKTPSNWYISKGTTHE